MTCKESLNEVAPKHQIAPATLIKWQKTARENFSRAIEARNTEIINSDQGSDFISAAYLNLLREHGVKVSMDGKGRCRDNIRTERFFRSLKHEDVYIKEYDGAAKLRSGVHAYINCVNRLHQSLGGRTPAEFYFGDASSSTSVEEK